MPSVGRGSTPAMLVAVEGVALAELGDRLEALLRDERSGPVSTFRSE